MSERGDKSDRENGHHSFWSGNGQQGSVLEAVLDAVEDAVFLVDVHNDEGTVRFRFQWSNAAYKTLTGLSRNEFTDKTPQELFGGRTGTEVSSQYRTCVEQREVIEYEETLDYPTQSTRWHTKLTPVLEDNEVTTLVGVSRDVTDRKDWERELERYKRFVESSSDAMSVVEPDGTITYGSPAIQNVLGYDPEDLIGENAFEYVHPEDLDEATAVFTQGIEDEPDERHRHELRFRNVEGEWRWIELRASVELDNPAIEGVLINSSDVTERKRAEQALQNERDTFADGPVVVFQWEDVEGWPVEYVSENVEDVFGYTSEQLLSGVVTYAEMIHEDDLERVKREAHEHRDCDRFSHEPYRIIARDGTVRWVMDHTNVVRNDEGEIRHRLGYLVDITQLREYEQQLEEQRDDLEILNQVVRHDIRNDLQLVMLYAELLADYVDEAGETYLSTLLESTESAVELTRTARELAEVMVQPDEELGEVSLAMSLEQQVEAVKSTYSGAVVTVEGRLPRGQVVGDDMVGSVFRNLLKNAIQHNDKEVPEVTISTEEMEDHVLVRVADNGPGVPDEMKADIFGKGERGFGSDGTGLGLYLVQSLVDRYGGDVWVEDRAPASGADESSASGSPAGAVFVVELPLAE